MADLKRNPKQTFFLQAVLNNMADSIKKGAGAFQRGFTAFFQGGRGSGKTFTLLDLIAISAFNLPRALSGLGSRTFKQVIEIILSQSSKVFEQYGLYEYDAKHRPWGNYVIFKAPPSHWHRPYTAPKDYQNCISWATGYTLMTMSADRPDTQRGLSLDQYYGDEIGFTKQSFHNDIVVAGLRGNKYMYHDTRPGRKGHNHPLHWLTALFSSAPRSLEYTWIYDFEEKAKRMPDRYLWLESTAYDNIENLPGDFINTLKETMNPMAFEVEVMNRRPKKAELAFYPAFNATRHCYTSYGYDYDPESGTYKISSSDYDPWKPLELSFDFNAGFTSCICCQDYDKELRIFDLVWVKEATDKDLVEEILERILNKFKHHLKRTVTIYGDYSGKSKSAGNKRTHYETIIGGLKKAGWVLIDEVVPNADQDLRYKVNNAVLREDNTRLPRVRINEDKCGDLVYSIQYAETAKGEFKKDKSSETNKAIPGEKATHLSDCFDYIIFKKFSHLIESNSSRPSMLTMLSS